MKYGNIRIISDGEVFDSKLERRRYEVLKLLERAGYITALKHHERFILIEKSKYGREIYYEADFTYYEKGALIVEDCKCEATKTPLYKLKKRLLAEKYGYLIKEITCDDF